MYQTDLEDCADAFVAAAKNSSMTGQNIQIGEADSSSIRLPILISRRFRVPMK